MSIMCMPEKQTESADIDVSAENVEQTNQIAQDPVKADSSLISRYELLERSGSDYEKQIISKILDNIEQYAGKPFSQEYLTVGNIDNIRDQDTIRTQVYVADDSVVVHSRWFRENSLLWEEILVDPYKWISDDVLFEYPEVDIWARLTIAVDYSIPQLAERANFSNISPEMAINSGLSELLNDSIDISEEQYRKYFEDFEGAIVQHGEPEIRQLSIWFEPLKKFVSYYRR